MQALIIPGHMILDSFVMVGIMIVIMVDSSLVGIPRCWWIMLTVCCHWLSWPSRDHALLQRSVVSFPSLIKV